MHRFETFDHLNYREITLTSFLGKLLKKLFSQTQAGSKKHYRTAEYIIKMYNDNVYLK